MGGCFVPGCNSGQRNSDNSRLFRPSPEIFPEWMRIMSKLRKDTIFNLNNKNHRVCSIHFEDHCISKFFVHNVNGEVVKIPRGRWKLDQNAIPTIFPSVPKSIQPKPLKQRRILVRQQTNCSAEKSALFASDKFSPGQLSFKYGYSGKKDTDIPKQEAPPQTPEEVLHAWIDSNSTNYNGTSISLARIQVTTKSTHPTWKLPFATRNAAKGKELYKIILRAVIELEEIGAEVLSVVRDESKPNRAFWKQFGVGRFGNEVINKISHPCDETGTRKLFFRSDVPHLFKCMRNHIMKYTNVDFFGKEVDFSFYEKLFKEDARRLYGLRKCPKLTQSHIRPNCFEKMVVSLATQLLSRSVATGLCFYRTSGLCDFQGSEETEKFTYYMNDVFDALNARFPSEGVTLGLRHFKILQEFLGSLRCYNDYIGEHENMAEIRFASSETLLGLEVTVASTLEIVEYLINELGYSYVLTGKITQDCLERFFGLIRAAGGQEDHPTVTNFVQLFRLLSLYNPVKRILKGNTRDDEELTVLVQFVDDFRQMGKENREARCILKSNMEDIMIRKLWEAESTPGSRIYEGDTRLLDRNIVHHLCGFLCYKAKRWVKCEECLESLNATTPEVNPEDTIMTDIMNYGSLHYPSRSFFEIFLLLEKSICIALSNHTKSGDIMLQCIQNIAFTEKLKIGCSETGHLESLVMSLLPYYITMRLHFFTRCQRNILGHGKATRNKRKESKLSS